MLGTPSKGSAVLVLEVRSCTATRGHIVQCHRCFLSCMGRVTCGPSSSGDTRIGALRDLEPLQDTLTDEDIHYWTHGDDEEDEATVRALIEAAEDPEEAFKQCLHCGRGYVEEILDD